MPPSSQIIFRTEGGEHIGFGHLRRCLSLAERLRQVGTDSLFILHGAPEVCQIVQSAGFKCVFFSTDEDDLADTIQLARRMIASVIVVDSYTLSFDYYYGLLETGIKIVAIDDLADHELPVHLVVNGSIGAEELPYRCLKNTRFLLGSKYILLRPEFSSQNKRKIADEISCVLITVGGSDSYDLTSLLMHSVKTSLGSIRVDVVIGPFFQNRDKINAEALKNDSQFILHHDSKNIRSLMVSADLALCGGGLTTYELAATGTPALGVRIAENQTANLRGLASAGVLLWAGDVNDLNLENKVCKALKFARSSLWRQNLSDQGQRLVDGRGVDRVVQSILEL